MKLSKTERTLHNTYAQNLRLRKIQNRRHSGENLFNIGKRGEPIPGKIDPNTIARRQRRAFKRPENLKKRIKSLENQINWANRELHEIEKAFQGKQLDQKTKRIVFDTENHKCSLQQTLLLAQQSLAALNA